MRTLMTLAICAILMTGTPAVATILTFDIDDGGTGDPVMEASLITDVEDYGDNVTSTSTTSGVNTYNYLEGNGFTPNVTVGYSITSPNDPDVPNDLKTLNYSLWDQAVWASGSASGVAANVFFTLTPDSGFLVKANSIGLQFQSSNSPSADGTWNVRKDSTGGAVLASGSFSIPAGTTSLQTLDISASGFFEGVVVVEIASVGSGVKWGDMAFENLNFDQAVPEPSTFAMMLVSLAALGLLAWRKRRV